MLQNVGLAANTNINSAMVNKSAAAAPISAPIVGTSALKPNAQHYQSKIVNFNTILSESDKVKYSYLLNYLKNQKPSVNSEGLTPAAQLDLLLKNGKLLSRTHNDRSTTLDNLYDIATVERANGVSNMRILCDTLDLLVNPRYVTQQFGDIPKSEVKNVLSVQQSEDEVVQNPDLMNVEASGVCPAAAMEVNAADKYPAEFARWISKLSSKDMVIDWEIDLKSINSNPLDAAYILNTLKVPNSSFSYKKNNIQITADLNTYVREKIQSEHHDFGERNTADVLFQGAMMYLCTQGTYNSLTDVREPIFNDNTQGLVEIEKTLGESIFKNKEITSLVYQQIDENQNLVGYTCSFDKIAKHITDTIDSGDDVIIGYVLTNETAGRTKFSEYNPSVDGAPNQIINGHEITIVDYMKDEKGKINFVCIDTDDNTPDFVVYSADWLLPKIHHAGYPASIVRDDEKEIMSKLI